MKESKNETMETLAERNQNAAKRQLYYIFILIAGLIAVLFLLFVIKKITKRFAYSEVPTTDSDPQNFIYLVISSTILPGIAIMGSAALADF